ncbi:ATP-binding protein [Streptomyces sp. NPDC003697]
MTAPTHHGERPTVRTVAPLPVLTAVLAAAAVAAAVAAAPTAMRIPLLWGAGGGALALCAAVTWAVHASQTARVARRRLEAAADDAGRLARERARDAEEARREQQRLIDELARQRAEFADALAQEKDRLQSGSDRLARDNARLTEQLRQAARERATAISATSNAAARLQALATATLADLRSMEERHSDEDVLADLLHLDHRTAQAGRLADSVAVLTGARSGRRWARPIAMESILRGAMGRISGYQRVRVHATSESAVAGHAAEGVMHALAELLDNAANFSPPTAEVHVYVEEVPAGVIVSVEDSGLVMSDVQLRRAEQAVSGDTSGLGGLTGTRLGLSVVGRLARKYGLKVSFRPSARGGTGVLMLIPQDILTSPAAPERPTQGLPRPAAGQPPAARAPHLDAAPVHEAAADDADERPAGLPRRRRGRTLAQAERARSTAGSAEARATPVPEDARARAARFSSFREAVRTSAQHQATGQAPVPRPGTEREAHSASEQPGTTSGTPTHPSAHPEGDTTS